MIPGGNLWTASPVISQLLPPADEPYDPLVETVQGGVALNDGSQGRRVRPWTVQYNSPSILIGDETGAIHATLVRPNAATVSLAFDNNMQYNVAYQTSEGTRWYYFDTLTLTYVDRLFPGTSSCRCAVDDTRPEYNTNSDVILGYTRNGFLYYRQQRDRYDIEYPVGPAPNGKLVRIGQSLLYRLTFVVDPTL